MGREWSGVGSGKKSMLVQEMEKTKQNDLKWEMVEYVQEEWQSRVSEYVGERGNVKV